MKLNNRDKNKNASKCEIEEHELGNATQILSIS